MRYVLETEMAGPTDKWMWEVFLPLSPVRNIADSISIFLHPLFCSSPREEERIK